jgi:hypothetical protein
VNQRSVRDGRPPESGAPVAFLAEILDVLSGRSLASEGAGQASALDALRSEIQARARPRTSRPPGAGPADAQPIIAALFA